jgi:hypothetical protein
LNEMVDVAEKLRQVRSARQRFLHLWAIEQALILPGLDRVAADIYGDRTAAALSGARNDGRMTKSE